MKSKELADILMEYPELDVEISICIEKKSLLDKLFMHKKRNKAGKDYFRALDSSDLYYGDGKVSITAFLDL